MVEGTPPGDALPPPPQRATPARKGARCAAGAGSPGPHRPHPGHTGCGTLAARSRGRATGGGTAPDTRRPSQRSQATPPGDGPPPAPRHAAPSGYAGQGDSVGPPHPHTRACSTWVADPNSPPSRRAVGGGTAPDLRRPSQWWKAPPRGRPSATPTASNAGPQGRTLLGRCWVPTPAPTAAGTNGTLNPGCPLQRTGGRGEGQRPTPDAPHNGGRPPPPRTAPPPTPWHAAPTGHASQGDSVGPPHPHTRAHSTWVADPNSPPSGLVVRGGGAPDHRRPSQRWKAPPQERPSATPTSSNAGPQGRTLWGRCWVPRPHRPHPGHTGRGTPAARPRGQAAGGGTAPDTRRPSQRWQATPTGDGPPPPPRHAAPTGHAGQGDSVGTPHPHTRAKSMWVADSNSPPSRRGVQGGGAPDHRRPSQQWTATPRERLSATPTASNAGPQGRTLWDRCWVPNPAPTAPGTHGSRKPGYPPQRTDGRGRDSA